MGLEYTRSSNTRCPPFLVGGLMIMCLFFLCNWWSLSSENFELLRQNDKLAEQLRINGEELRKCQEWMAERSAQIKQLKESDQELQLQFQTKEKELSEVKDRADNFMKEKEMCQTEMESLRKLGKSKDNAMESLRTEKTSFEKTLNESRKELAELREKLKQYELVHKGNDMKLPIPILKERERKKDLEQKNDFEGDIKANLNEFSEGKIENMEVTMSNDENNGGEIKNDLLANEPDDAREKEMGMNENSLGNR